MAFNHIRYDIELIFEKYRKHKYYTLFKRDYNVNVTSQVDEIGGGRSNQTSDKVANAAIKMIDEKEEALRFVSTVEDAVNQLPEIEAKLIRLRYMDKDHNYINDYMIYQVKMFVSAPYYQKIRRRAFVKLYTMLDGLV